MVKGLTSLIGYSEEASSSPGKAILYFKLCRFFFIFWITCFSFGLFPFILTAVLLKLREDFAITYF